MVVSVVVVVVVVSVVVVVVFFYENDGFKRLAMGGPVGGGGQDGGRGCVQRCLSSPRAACNNASAAPRIFEAKQCFKSCRMSQRMAPSFKASPTVVATLYCSYRCHAAVLGRFGLRVTKRMPSPSSTFITRVKVARKYATHPPRTPWGCTQLCLKHSKV